MKSIATIRVLTAEEAEAIAERAALKAVTALLRSLRKLPAHLDDQDREVSIREGAKLARIATAAYNAALITGEIPSRFEAGGRGGKGRRLAKVRDVMAWAKRRNRK